MTLNEKLIKHICIKFVRIVVTLKVCVNFGYVESNFFINRLHFFFKLPIPHSTHIMHTTSIVL
jgi:hypothetical protein